MPVYEYVTVRGQNVAILKDGRQSFAIPKVGESEDIYLENPDYVQFKKDVGAGIPVIQPPPVLTFSDYQNIASKIVTTDNSTVAVTPIELFRFPLELRTLYKAKLELLAISRTGLVKEIEAKIVAKRLNAGAVLLGMQATAPIQDAGASSWVVNAPTVQGNFIVCTISGQAGLIIDWELTGSLKSVTPQGR